MFNGQFIHSIQKTQWDNDGSIEESSVRVRSICYVMVQRNKKYIGSYWLQRECIYICVFNKNENNVRGTILLYVDDLFITSNVECEVKAVSQALKNKYGGVTT